MTDVNDMTLLRQFADDSSEPAFSELVRRHINLVYSVALRSTGNTGDAEDITQAVFIILAQKAARLSNRVALTGWLYETTRFTAMRWLRTQARRRVHEQEASVQSIIEKSGDDSLWRQVEPNLEAAMSRLRERDRTLLALRYFENKTGAEAAALLGIKEEAARKQTNRALEKLQKFFARRGIRSTTAILAGTISANSVLVAPEALAKSLTPIALAKGATASISTVTLIKGALKIMAWTKAKTAIVVSAGLLFAIGTTTVVTRQIKARPYTVQRAPWSDAGAATPKATLQSLLWAFSTSNWNRAGQLMQWDETGTPFDPFSMDGHKLILLEIAQKANEIKSFHIVSIAPASQRDDLLVGIEGEKEYPESPPGIFSPMSLTVNLRHVGSQWHAVGKIDYYENKNVSSRLPFW